MVIGNSVGGGSLGVSAWQFSAPALQRWHERRTVAQHDHGSRPGEQRTHRRRRGNRLHIQRVASGRDRGFQWRRYPDILWRNSNTGEVDTWLITNGHVSGATAVGVASSAWQLLGVGDFNGDGTSDVLWRNTNTGEVDTWLLANGHVAGGSGVSSVSSAWQFIGTGDYNGDGTSDVLWRNTTTGEVDTWLMNNGHIVGGNAVGSVSTAWVSTSH